MDLTPVGIIGTIVFGAVIGVLARFFKPGKQDISILATVVIGIIGAVAGYLIWGAISDTGNTNGIDWIRWIISIIVAIIGIGIYLGLRGRGAARR